ncbi:MULTISPECIES: ABC transporter permease [Peptoniphilus]|uniref:ABC transporter permease n=1 Tax=Peptoniphilus TaxID=162289 RepID=UPI0001DA9CDF|nr:MULTISPECIES: ABC transporter permease subunit [Peptoniphilus]EFI42259.1 hypothetical protein HMPREF0629_00904 [Peptoniphilus sp. oral taxon 386 str. F0131]
MIFSREFKSNIGKLVAWTIVLFILVGLLLALYYPMMLDINMKSMFDGFVSSLNPNFKNILGFDENIDYTELGQYIAFIYQYIAVLVVIFAMQLGANSLSKEQSSGSIQYIYSNPISRSEIMIQKLLSDVLVYFIFLVLLAALTIGLLYVIPMEVAISLQAIIIDIVRIFVAMLLSGLVYMSIGYFFSAISNNTTLSDATSVLFVLITVVIVIIGKIYGAMFFTIVDFFALEVFKPFRFLVSNISIVGVGINLAIFAIFILLSFAIYNSKELNY